MNIEKLARAALSSRSTDIAFLRQIVEWHARETLASHSYHSMTPAGRSAYRGTLKRLYRLVDGMALTDKVTR
ncbi:hypothetical protein LCGC14_1498280 [marine sediment metagenome]|uniref:Core-binding (CB) domain-containing protein n=1 Tax=marine sediment metagenome TaxID=412755 RepID=A0A0F9J4T9_9ZZZZ